MKHETLVTRYKNLGYVRLNLKEEQELDNIISWIYQSYNILIVIRPIIGMERRLTNLHLEKEGKKPMKPTQIFGWSDFDFLMGLDIGSTHSSLGRDAFETPLQAKHECLKKIYAHIKFRFH